MSEGTEGKRLSEAKERCEETEGTDTSEAMHSQEVKCPPDDDEPPTMPKRLLSRVAPEKKVVMMDSPPDDDEPPTMPRRRLHSRVAPEKKVVMGCPPDDDEPPTKPRKRLLSRGGCDGESTRR